MNGIESAAIIKLSLGPWPQFVFNPDTVASFALVLEEISFIEAQEAVITLLKDPSREKPPTPGEIRGEVERSKKCATVPRITGPILETYTQEHTIAGKKVTFGYIRTTAEAREAYKASAEAQGRKYTEAHASKGTAWDPECAIPAPQMHHLFNELYKLMDDYEAANDEEARAACDKRRDALKQFYFDVAREAR